MIRPLRRRHDRMFVLLLIALPIFLASAIAVRPDEDLLRGPTPDVLSMPSPSGSVDGASSDGKGLDVHFGQLPKSPALLLYWVPDLSVSPGAEGALPGYARLLGAARSHTSTRFPLPAPGPGPGPDPDPGPAPNPDPAADGAGALLLYSLGHQRVVGEPVTLDAGALTGPVLVGEAGSEGTDR